MGESLNYMVHNVELTVPSMNFDNDFQKYKIHDLARERILEDNGYYYRAIGAYCKIYKPKKVIEVGTYFGTSAMCMAQNAGTVYTYDITDAKYLDGLRTAKNIVFNVLNKPENCLKIDFSKTDLIFLDIGDHNGEYESEIHQLLINSNWNGLVFYDDINWNDMKLLWKSIENDKIETNWHRESGFGIVKYISPENHEKEKIVKNFNEHALHKTF